MRISIVFLFLLAFTLNINSQVVINEFLSSNVDGILDEDQEFSDWIEIYNYSDQPQNISGFGLSDDKSMPSKWTFPALTLSAHQYILVFASDKNRKPLNFEGLHTNFKMDADSENVYLFDNHGVLIDSGMPVSMIRDVSFGRKPDGSAVWGYFGSPTPCGPNANIVSLPIQADTVIFTPPGGNHTGGITLTLSTSDPADSIYYTTDGSVPGSNDQLYTTPLEISATTSIRARAMRYDRLPGFTVTQTYVTMMDHDIPIVCLTTEPDHLWNVYSGIYAFGLQPPGEYPYTNANFWKDWERPINMELYDVQGVGRINQEVGTKIFGGWSRASNQKSMALYARKSYGQGSFKYQFFSDKPIEKFESVVLRNSGNDNMGLQFHDCFMTGLTRDMNIDRQAYQPAAVYLNGVYWGLLNIREKVGNNYIAENHIVDPDSVNLLEGRGSIIDGSSTGYDAITNYLNTKTTLQNDADYIWVRDQIDVDNYIQYQLTQIYLNNRDWPGNNIKFWNTTSAGSKWRWIIYDTDFGYGIWNTNDYMSNTLAFALMPTGPDWPNPPWSTQLFRRLVTNPGFRKNFILQYCDRLNFDFHPNRVISDLDSLKSLYDQEIVYNFNKWGSNYNDWLWRIGNRKVFGQYRPTYCRQHMASQFQLEDQFNVTLQVSGNAHGYIKLNSITPKVYPFTGVYFENIPIKMTAIPKPGYRFVRWEGTVQSIEASISYHMNTPGTFKAVFTEAAAEDLSLIINEINYSSSEAKNTKDWVELYNNGTTSVDLNGWLLIDSDEDSGYVFQPGTVMIPGSYLVVCRDLEDFRSFYPAVNNVVGDMLCGLSSDGDIVRLFDHNRVLIDAVNYGPFEPWPEGANGTGASLELENPALNNALAESWVSVGITPGTANTSIALPVSPVISENNMVFECFPNPFRDFTTISFDVETSGHYKLDVIDNYGRIIKVLADNYLSTGLYWMDWHGEGSDATGVFTIRLTGEQTSKTLKVVRLR